MAKFFLQSQTVLYTVFILALSMLLSLIYLQNISAMMFLVVAGVLVSFFTKNMIKILSAACLLTAGFMYMRGDVAVADLWSGRSSFEEGFKSKDKKKKKKATNNSSTTQATTTAPPSKEAFSEKEVDAAMKVGGAPVEYYEKKVEDSYKEMKDNLEKLIEISKQTGNGKEEIHGDDMKPEKKI